jgi:HemY protein
VRLLIIILSGLLAAIGIGTLLSRDAGLMIFSYAGYNIQMSMSLFVLILLVLFVGTYFVFRLLGGLIRLPKNVNRWSLNRRYQRSEKYLSQGILASLEGDWPKAEESFQRGARHSRLPLVNYLAAARAAQHLGAILRRDHYLRLAHESSPEAALAIGLTQAKLQLSESQTEQAYATLKHLVKDPSAQDDAKGLLLEAATELKEWPEALRLLNDPKCKKLLPAEQLKERRLAVYAGLLREAAEVRDRIRLDREWENIPRKLKGENYLIKEYVDARFNFPDTSDCEHLLRKTLNANWDEALVRQYGLVEGDKIVKQIQFAERLLLAHSREPALLLALGRLCKRNSLWGKAKSYLQDSLSAQPSAEAYQELALLLEQQGEHVAAGLHFQKGLALATGLNDRKNMVLLEGSDNANVESAGKIA